MKFIETSLSGVWAIDLEKSTDNRGYFARTYCKDSFGAHNLHFELDQISISANDFRGTVRGLHMQSAPCAETKVVRCSRGSIYDVVVDLRANSATYLKFHAEILSEQNQRSLYIPPGCCHGYQTLSGNSEITYLIAGRYNPNCHVGVRWNDPAINIPWPLDMTIISERDANYNLITI